MDVDFSRENKKQEQITRSAPVLFVLVTEGLYVETEQNYVAVFYNIFLTF